MKYVYEFEIDDEALKNPRLVVSPIHGDWIGVGNAYNGNNSGENCASCDEPDVLKTGKVYREANTAEYQALCAIYEVPNMGMTGVFRILSKKEAK